MHAPDARFRTIHTDAGYNTDLGAQVHHFQAAGIDEDTCPILIYRDTDDNMAAAPGRRRRHTVPLEIELKYAVADVNYVYAGIQDVTTLFGVIDRSEDLLDGLLMNCEPVSDAIEVNSDGRTNIVTATVTINLIYETDKWEI